jgi:hypothetical protein
MVNRLVALAPEASVTLTVQVSCPLSSAWR